MVVDHAIVVGALVIATFDRDGGDAREICMLACSLSCSRSLLLERSVWG